MKYLTRIIDLINEWSGRVVMWLALLLFVITAYETIQRYLFRVTSVALQETTWHLYAFLFLLGMAYTLKHDRHVRVDIFYDRMSGRLKAWTNLFGMVVLILPFCLLIIYFSWSFMLTAYQIGERSGDPGGLPARWILKAAIPVGFGLLLLQGISEIFKSLIVILQDQATSSKGRSNSEKQEPL